MLWRVVDVTPWWPYSRRQVNEDEVRCKTHSHMITLSRTPLEPVSRRWAVYPVVAELTLTIVLTHIGRSRAQECVSTQIIKKNKTIEIPGISMRLKSRNSKRQTSSSNNIERRRQKNMVFTSHNTRWTWIISTRKWRYSGSSASWFRSKRRKCSSCVSNFRKTRLCRRSSMGTAASVSRIMTPLTTYKRSTWFSSSFLSERCQRYGPFVIDRSSNCTWRPDSAHFGLYGVQFYSGFSSMSPIV